MFLLRNSKNIENGINNIISEVDRLRSLKSNYSLDLHSINDIEEHLYNLNKLKILQEILNEFDIKPVDTLSRNKVQIL